MRNYVQKMTMAILVAVFLVAGANPALSADINDADALKGVTSGKALYDVNLSEAKKLTLYLKVIKMSYEGLKAQGVTPDFVVAFRGHAVQLIDKAHADAGDQAGLAGQIAGQIAELRDMGVRFEACSVATNLFKVDNDNLLPGVKVVANTFNSLIGYQARGYALVPVM